MSGESGGVRVREEDGVLRLVLDRPPVNVLDREAIGELDRALEEAAGREEVRVLCLTGAGQAFCAGVSVEDHLPGRVEETLSAFGDAVKRILGLPFPAVAAVNGAALGGGCELTAACDLVVARDGAKLGQPEIRLGVFPPVAAALLPRLVGRQRALDLILTGRTLDAEEALRAGLVQHLLPAASWEEELEGFLGRLSGLSRPVLRLARRATLEGAEGPVEEAIDRAERTYLDELMELADPREGLEAFLEDREPAWEDA